MAAISSDSIGSDDQEHEESEQTSGQSLPSSHRRSKLSANHSRSATTPSDRHPASKSADVMSSASHRRTPVPTAAAHALSRRQHLAASGRSVNKRTPARKLDDWETDTSDDDSRRGGDLGGAADGQRGQGVRKAVAGLVTPGSEQQQLPHGVHEHQGSGRGRTSSGMVGVRVGSSGQRLARHQQHRRQRSSGEVGLGETDSSNSGNENEDSSPVARRRLGDGRALDGAEKARKAAVKLRGQRGAGGECTWKP